MTIFFGDVTGIAPGDEDEYARVLIELWQSNDDGENMPPDVRRACARWSHKSLWSVARDGFLGRA